MLSRSAELPDEVNKAATLKQITDISAVPEITEALHGQDAVVACANAQGIKLQFPLIDAAIAAGVRHFIPSEYGGPPDNEAASSLPMFAEKVRVRKHLAEKANAGKISYTLIGTSMFFDWALPLGLVMNVSGDKPNRIFDGGDISFSCVLRDDVGKAIAGILSRPDEYKNRTVNVNSLVITQNQVIAAAKKASVPGKPWPMSQEKLSDAWATGMEIFKTGGDPNVGRANLLFCGLLDPKFGASPSFSQEDSKKLGIRVLSEKEVEELVGGYVRKLQSQ